MVKKTRKTKFVQYSHEAVETISQKKLQEQESAKTQSQGEPSSNKRLGKSQDNKKRVSPSFTTVQPDTTDITPANKEEQTENQGTEQQNVNTETEPSKQIKQSKKSQKPKAPIENNSPKSSNNNCPDSIQHTCAELNNPPEEIGDKPDIKSKDTSVKVSNSANTESPAKSSKLHPDNPAWINNSRLHPPMKHPFGSTLNPNASEFKPTSNPGDQDDINLPMKNANILKNKQFVPQVIAETNQNLTKGLSDDTQKQFLKGKTSDTNDSITHDHGYEQSVLNEAYDTLDTSGFSVDCQNSTSKWCIDQSTNEGTPSKTVTDDKSRWNNEARGDRRHGGKLNNNYKEHSDFPTRSSEDRRGNQRVFSQRGRGRNNEERNVNYNSDSTQNKDDNISSTYQSTQRPYRGRGRNNEERNVNYNSDSRQNKDEDIPSTYQPTPRPYDDPNGRSNNFYQKRNIDQNQNPNNFRGHAYRGHKEFGPRGNSRSNQNRYKDGQHFGGSKFDNEGNQARRSDNYKGNTDWRAEGTEHRYDNQRNDNKWPSRGHNYERGRYNSRGRNNPTGRTNSYNRRQSSDVDIATDDSSKDSSSNYHITDEDSNDVPERKVDPVDPSWDESWDRNDWNNANNSERKDLVEPGWDENWDRDNSNDSANKSHEAVLNQSAPVHVGSAETSQEQTWETSGGNQRDAAWTDWNDEPSEVDLKQSAIAEPLNDTVQHNSVQASPVAEVGVPSQPRKTYEDDLNKMQADRVMPKYNKDARRSFEPRPHDRRDPRIERMNKSADDADWRSLSGSASGSEQNLKQTRMTSYLGNKDPSRDKSDKEYDLFEDEWRKIKEFNVVKEIQGDLFQQPKDYSLAHCVAEDLRMGSGIAVDFKREFKNVPDLLDQRAKQGGLATVQDTENKRFVYYLVTKRESTGKPTYQTLWKSLKKMKDHIIKNEVKKLAVPRLGCGLDRLEWNKVKPMIEYIFRDIDLEITVCNFQQDEDTPKKSNTCKYVIKDEYPINEIESGTLIFYFSTETGDEDSIMSQMSRKFNFLPKFRSTKPKRLGDLIYSEDGKYGLCGCVVRKTVKDQISFKSLWKCMQEFNKMNKNFKNDAFTYVAFQWVDKSEYKDDFINEKILTVLINALRYVEVYACRGDFKDHEKQ